MYYLAIYKPELSKYHAYALKGSYWYLAFTALIWIVLLLNTGKR